MNGYLWMFFQHGPWLLLLLVAVLKLRRWKAWPAWLQLACAGLLTLWLMTDKLVVGPLLAEHFRTSPDADFPGWSDTWSGLQPYVLLIAIPGFCAGYFMESLLRRGNDSQQDGKPGTLPMVAVVASLLIVPILVTVSHGMVGQIANVMIFNWAWMFLAAGAIIMLRRESHWALGVQVAGAALLACFMGALDLLTNGGYGLLKGSPLWGPSPGWVYPRITTEALVIAIGAWIFAGGALAWELKRPKDASPEPAARRRALSRVAIPLTLAVVLCAGFLIAEFGGIRTGRLPFARQRTANLLGCLSTTINSGAVRDDGMIFRRFPWPKPEEVTSETVINAKQVAVELGLTPGTKRCKDFFWLSSVPRWCLTNGRVVDGWGNEVRFRVDPATGDAVIWSCGPDGKDDTNDGVSPDPVRFPQTYYWFGTCQRSDDLVMRVAARKGRPAPIDSIADPNSRRLVRLKGDAEASRRVQEDLAVRIPRNATSRQKASWLYQIARDLSAARDNEAAAEYMLESTDLCPEVGPYHAGRSVFLGKAGHFRAAEAEALKALELEGPGAMHPNMVLASWEWALGKRDQALSRIKSVPVPEDPEHRRVYYDCLACFHASAGDERQTEAAMKNALENDPAGAAMAFFRRDVAFDPYRAKPWFIDLVGETLDNEQPPLPRMR